jgi:hypothetical protein
MRGASNRDEHHDDERVKAKPSAARYGASRLHRFLYLAPLPSVSQESPTAQTPEYLVDTAINAEISRANVIVATYRLKPKSADPACVR